MPAVGARLARSLVSITCAGFVSPLVRSPAGAGGTLAQRCVSRVLSRACSQRARRYVPRHPSSRGAMTTATNGKAGMPFPRGEPTGETIVSLITRFQDVFVDPQATETATKIEIVAAGDWSTWFDNQSDSTKAWLNACRKASKPSKSTVLLIPSFDTDNAAKLRPVMVGLESGSGVVWSIAELAKALPANTPYAIDTLPDGVSPVHVELGWGLAAYSYKLYKSKSKKKDSSIEAPASLVRLCKGKDAERVEATLGAVYLVRDLISTPTEDMGPASLMSAVFKLGSLFDAKCTSVIGDDLLNESSYFPQVHSVGRAATSGRAPRLLELRWNDGAAKSIALVGKGVCYDTGGLSLKPTSGMLHMKKDMGGAAHVLALGYMIMKMNLDIGLRILVPAVENAVGPESYRPGDVIVARNNTTTEVTNTDAEGRLILADALVAACEENPALIVDFATLTGAQRIALGPDIPSFWSTSEDIAASLNEKCGTEDDLMWRLPLHKPYRKNLDSTIADIKNCGTSGHGGAITAALYLKEFVDDNCPWIHVDLNAYNLTSRPGRPEGGEAMGLRAMFALVESVSAS